MEQISKLSLETLGILMDTWAKREKQSSSSDSQAVVKKGTVADVKAFKRMVDSFQPK